MAEDKNQSSARDLLLRTIAVVGLVAVLLLGAWGIILIAFNLPNLFGTLGASVGSLFTQEQVEQQPTQTTTTQQTTPATTNTNTATSKPTNTQYTASNTYTALYGSADLAVRILSVMPAGSRTNVQFEIQNVGSNVTPSNWSFEAELPANPTYTYQSIGQQALYPGDKIVYTIGFDTPYTYNNWYCTQQYPNYNCPNYSYSYNQQYPYNYYNSGTCYHYDGYINHPTTCPGQSYQNLYGTTGRVVTITVDRYNLVTDYNRYNNTASIAI